MYPSHRLARLFTFGYLLIFTANLAQADAPPAAEQEVRQFLESVMAAAAAGDRATMTNQLDTFKLSAECLKQAGLELNVFQRIGLNVRLSRQIIQDFATLIEEDSEFEVRSIELDPDGQSARAIVRITDQDGIAYYLRFWVARKNGNWKWYDLEDMNLGIPTTIVFGQVVQEYLALDDPPPASDMKWLVAARDAILAEDFAGAREILESADGREYPPTIEALRRLLMGATLLAQLEIDAALAALERAGQLRPDMPALHYLRAQAFALKEQPEKVLAEAQLYVEAIGPDPDAYLLIGSAHESLGRTEEALDAYRKALDDTPQSLDNFVALAGLLPADKKDELVQRFLAMPSPQEKFESVAMLLIDADDAESLEFLARAWRQHAPQDPNGIYYLAEAFLLKENHAAAAEILPESFPLVEQSEEREFYYDLYLQSMIGQDKFLEGYEGIPDKKLGFETLADELIEQERYDVLQQLIERHRKDFAQDPLAYYYEGDLHYFQERYEQADQLYAQAAELEPDEDLQEQIRYSRVYCWYHLGKGLEAYHQFEPKDATFEDLAAQFHDANETEQLRKLLDLHEADAGETDSTRLWRIRLGWLEKDYAGTVEMLEEHGKTLLEEYPYLVEYVWIRSLVHLARYDEALKHAKASTDRDGDPYYELLVHAVRGDVERCNELIPQVIESGYEASELLKDDMLGPALRSEALSELYQKYLAAGEQNIGEDRCEGAACGE